TSSSRDWSSDVCSSDLGGAGGEQQERRQGDDERARAHGPSGAARADGVRRAGAHPTRCRAENEAGSARPAQGAAATAGFTNLSVIRSLSPIASYFARSWSPSR